MFTPVCRSLRDLVDGDYLDAVIRTNHQLTGRPLDELRAVAEEPVDFFPAAFAERSAQLARSAGQPLVPGFDDGYQGAPTDAFRHAQNTASAPLGGLGVCRIGQDGRIHLAAKSEHYQLALGHAFPGYRLIDRARELGIPNATHNNTRGYITRRAESALVAAANGIVDDAELSALLSSPEPRALNRVLNLETGSLAAEAALKIMLTHFHEADGGEPEQPGVTPVFLVLGDWAGGLAANYHGTTVLAQLLRGLWPGLRATAADAGLFEVVPVPIDDIDGFRSRFARYHTGRYRVAGFCHEIVLMNYGGHTLDAEFLRAAYQLCHDHRVPVFCDEIQSGAWYGELFLFRRYGVQPDLVAIGKGFPGGVYPASRLILTRAADRLSQFGALVTNGQEELASLAYLITMEFVRANGDAIDAIGHSYQEQLAGLTRQFPELLVTVTGDGHMGCLQFREPEPAVEFCRRLDDLGIDTSTQAYKPSTPPTALTKLPLISDETTVTAVVDRMRQALQELSQG